MIQFSLEYYPTNTSGPYAVTGLTSTTGTLLPANDQIVDYTAFNKASHISQGSYDYFITYGTDRQRSMSCLTNLHRFEIRANILNTRSLTQLSIE
jgi:hypothetical protein